MKSSDEVVRLRCPENDVFHAALNSAEFFRPDSLREGFPIRLVNWFRRVDIPKKLIRDADAMKPILTCRSVLFLFVITSQLSLAKDQPLPESGTVYAKIVLPVESAREETHLITESWIAKKLRKRGKSDLRAVTHWVRLAEKGEKSTQIWNATVDGKGWGCPVVGRIVDRTKHGKVKVELLGWSPGGAEVKGQTLAAEIGRRKIAIVDTGEGDESGIAYVALFVGPALPELISTKRIGERTSPDN